MEQNESKECNKDSVYNLFTEDKNIIFKPKNIITKKDVEDIPELAQLREAIKIWEKILSTAQGRAIYEIKKIIIEMRKDQYVIKSAFRQTLPPISGAPKRVFPNLEYEESINPDGTFKYSGLSLMNPTVCANILKYYSGLKEEAYGNFEGDLWYYMEDFDKIADQALKDYPLLERLVELKIDKKQNKEIQEILNNEFNICYSIEYISSLWRKKVPKLIATEAEKEFLNYYYLNVKKGKYKYCRKCGTMKLAHKKFFDGNRYSSDGLYSVCKECRRKKREGKKFG